MAKHVDATGRLPDRVADDIMEAAGVTVLPFQMRDPALKDLEAMHDMYNRTLWMTNPKFIQAAQEKRLAALADEARKEQARVDREVNREVAAWIKEATAQERQEEKAAKAAARVQEQEEKAAAAAAGVCI